MNIPPQHPTHVDPIRSTANDSDHGAFKTSSEKIKDQDPIYRPLDSIEISKVVRNKETKSFFQKASSIVSWLLGHNTLIPPADSSKNHSDEEKEVPFHILELKKYSHHDVLVRANNAIDRLERTKEALIEEFGEASLGFIFRHIDPVIHSSKDLLLSIQRAEDHHYEKKESFPSHEARHDTLAYLLEGAVDAVELYAIMNDEEHLKRRIVHHVEHHVHQAVQKDIQIIQAYQATVGRELVISHSRTVPEVLKLIQSDLQPIIHKLEELAKSFPKVSDIRGLFDWRRAFDEKRHGLVALATLLVDLQLMRYSFFSLYYGEYGETESEGLVSERMIFVTEGQIRDVSILLGQFIETIARLRQINLYMQSLDDPLLESHTVEIVDEFQTVSSQFMSMAVHTSHSVQDLLASLGQIRGKLSLMAEPHDPPSI